MLSLLVVELGFEPRLPYFIAHGFRLEPSSVRIFLCSFFLQEFSQDSSSVRKFSESCSTVRNFLFRVFSNRQEFL